MLRRLFHKPLFIQFDETSWVFIHAKPRLRHSIKILMTAAQLEKADKNFHPGLYEVKFQRVQKRPMLVFEPLR
jgi:hypothetical protein